MTTIDELRRAAAGSVPPAGLRPALEALWRARAGDWDGAHECVQLHEGEAECDLVHAHLHRQEGDVKNAGAWYRSAGRAPSTAPIEEEWTLIATELLGAQPPTPAGPADA